MQAAINFVRGVCATCVFGWVTGAWLLAMLAFFWFAYYMAGGK